ncbi:MAG: hypothetical protein R2710_09075 [Acidimicrobiales bacterium]
MLLSFRSTHFSLRSGVDRACGARWTPSAAAGPLARGVRHGPRCARVSTGPAALAGLPPLPLDLRSGVDRACGARWAFSDAAGPSLGILDGGGGGK